jgi:hypothetical protein
MSKPHRLKPALLNLRSFLICIQNIRQRDDSFHHSSAGSADDWQKRVALNESQDIIEALIWM